MCVRISGIQILKEFRLQAEHGAPSRCRAARNHLWLSKAKVVKSDAGERETVVQSFRWRLCDGAACSTTQQNPTECSAAASRIM